MTNKQGSPPAVPGDAFGHRVARVRQVKEGAIADGRPQAREYLTAALKEQWRRYRKELKRCQRKFSEKAVHESRIEARRLLSSVDLLSAFLPAGEIEKARSLLKRHLDISDKLRDTHVQLLYLKRLLRTSPGLHPFHAALVRRERRCIRQTNRKIKRLKLARIARLIGDLGKHLRKERKQAVPRSNALSRLIRTVNGAFALVVERRRRIDPANTATIHRTRVAFKNFRYMVEALAPWLPGATPRRLLAMKNYQSLMGDIQDTEVLLASFERFIEKKEVESGSARRFRDKLQRRQRRLVEACLARANRLYGFWPLLSTRPPALDAAGKPK